MHSSRRAQSSCPADAARGPPRRFRASGSGSHPRMTMRVAALYGRDPTALRTAAEVLALRGIYPSVEAAHAGLLAVQAAKLPPKPEKRRPLRLWVQSVRRLLVFGGFISPPRGTPR